ncbi:hypothetical protein NIES970_00090 [[Synechococcus] sp. NIES-970]|uniref:Uma2 family endonuclease n=1 Tax=Picosynechococcus sp. NKBG15041c TaxID=1407650 RepID=UPI0004067B9D|nr:Uma2 family endonuclease [Picosynechococcus sp. NKBG15041c]BAW95109.1 hypothetical protein NIES970_00090 [[Synechococcus] sp. NIES-970]
MAIATDSQPTAVLSLEDFLQQPETKPAREFSHGVVTQKPMPKGKHGTLQFELTAAINQRTKVQKLAYAIPELRCTFGGRSLVPDIAVTRWERLPRDDNGAIADDFWQYPDWVIEILSPDQSSTLVMEKIIFCLGQGTEIGWLINPNDRSVTVLCQGQLPSIHFAEPISEEKSVPLPMMTGLEDWQLSASELFSWLEI